MPVGDLIGDLYYYLNGLSSDRVSALFGLFKTNRYGLFMTFLVILRGVFLEPTLKGSFDLEMFGLKLSSFFDFSYSFYSVEMSSFLPDRLSETNTFISLLILSLRRFSNPAISFGGLVAEN